MIRVRCRKEVEPKNSVITTTQQGIRERNLAANNGVERGSTGSSQIFLRFKVGGLGLKLSIKL